MPLDPDSSVAATVRFPWQPARGRAARTAGMATAREFSPADLDWRPDVLGADFEVAELELPADFDGESGASLVRLTPSAAAGRPAVLYLHGFVDYFFHPHVARHMAEHGYAFYALDLRRYGRSLREGQLFNYCDHLADYAAELTMAVKTLRAAGHRVIVGMAHSTGGLTMPLWADAVRGRGVLDALVLNSPFFNLNYPAWQAKVMTLAVEGIAPFEPHSIVDEGDSAYSWHLHRDNGGRWDYNLAWKPNEDTPTFAGWLRAVRRGQARLARGLAIDAPVLVCSSDRSSPNERDNPLLDCTDTVLNVADIAERADLLGPDVTYARIEGGIHDLALSADGPRLDYLRTVTDWLDWKLARPAR